VQGSRNGDGHDGIPYRALLCSRRAEIAVHTQETPLGRFEHLASSPYAVVAAGKTMESRQRPLNEKMAETATP
jgi:hypothetical protein